MYTLKNFRLIKLWYLNSTGNQFFFKSVEENGQPHTDWGRNKDQRRVFWTPITPTLYWWTMAHSTSLGWRSHFEPEWRTLLPTWKLTQAKVNKSIFINHQCRQFVLYTSAIAYLTWLSQFKFYLKRNFIEGHATLRYLFTILMNLQVKRSNNVSTNILSESLLNCCLTKAYMFIINHNDKFMYTYR